MRKRQRLAIANQRHAESLAKAQADSVASAAIDSRLQDEARLRAEAQSRALAESIAQQTADRERAVQNYNATIDTLTRAYQTDSSDYKRTFAEHSKNLPISLEQEINSIAPLPGPNTEQALLALIMQEKAQINDLIAIKGAQLESINHRDLDRQSEAPLNGSADQYKHYLENNSHGSVERALGLHEAWRQKESNLHQAKLLAESISLLQERSSTLSSRHAEAAFSRHSDHDVAASKSQETAESAAAKLWSIASAPPAPRVQAASRGNAVLEAATRLAKEQFVRTVVQRWGRSVPALLAIYPSETANAERSGPIIGTPLSELNLPDGLDLGYIADRNGSLELTHRLMFQHHGSEPKTEWIKTDGVAVGTKVRVRNFSYNSQNNTYEFFRDGDAVPALIWTPIVRPEDSSTSSPEHVPEIAFHPGTPATPVVPELVFYPETDRNDPDDYILKSPTGSGLPDSYILFKDPRADAGIAGGYGKPVSGEWLGPEVLGGSPVPSHIADQLRGRRFSHFSQHRQALWKAVANDPVLSKNFSLANLKWMSLGKAPECPIEDRVGKREKFEIHHANEVAKGGLVYDMDNWLIMTPSQHIEHHKGNKNDQ
jgi:type II secretory pathway pseudopilin PulG